MYYMRIEKGGIIVWIELFCFITLMVYVRVNPNDTQVFVMQRVSSLFRMFVFPSRRQTVNIAAMTAARARVE